MDEIINFYEVFGLEKKCSRRLMLSLMNIKGRSQYFTLRKRYERAKIYEFLHERFSEAKYEEYNVNVNKDFSDRIKSENITNLIDNLKTVIKRYKLRFLEINSPITYQLNTTPIKIGIDGIGTFEEAKTLFYLNMTTRFNRNDAHILVCGESALKSLNVKKLIVLKLGSGDFREINKKGDLTEKGTLKKTGLLPWDELRKEADEILEKGIELQQRIKDTPDMYNIPIFGTCGTCPYHNYEVEFKGEKIICTG